MNLIRCTKMLLVCVGIELIKSTKSMSIAYIQFLEFPYNTLKLKHTGIPQIRIYFLKDPDLRTMVGLQDLFNDLYYVERMSISISCLKPMIATEQGKVLKKNLFYFITIFYYIRLILVSDSGFVSPLFSTPIQDRKGYQI